MNLLPNDILRLIISPDAIGHAGCYIMSMVCVGLNLIAYPADKSLVSKEVAMNGQLHIIKWLRESGWKFGPKTFAYAAGSGQLETLEYLGGLGIRPRDATAGDYAATRGHLEVIKWLHAAGHMISPDAHGYSIKKGHYETAKWIYECIPYARYTESRISRAAAASGNLELYIWANKFDHRARSYDYARSCDYAARYGHIHILKWILRTRGPIRGFCDRWAAFGGHLEILE